MSLKLFRGGYDVDDQHAGGAVAGGFLAALTPRWRTLGIFGGAAMGTKRSHKQIPILVAHFSALH